MIKVGLDIGNSKISCVVCDLRKNQKPKMCNSNDAFKILDLIERIYEDGRK